MEVNFFAIEHSYNHKWHQNLLDHNNQHEQVLKRRQDTLANKFIEISYELGSRIMFDGLLRTFDGLLLLELCA